jgi:hypothetical protein
MPTTPQDAAPAPAPMPAPAPTADVKPEIPSVPDSWPGAFGLFKYSKKAILLNANTKGMRTAL